MSIQTYSPGKVPPEIKDPRYKPYQPFGGSLDVFYDRSPEILICGPAGTGKSRGVLEKIHLCCSKYPGMRALLVRKTRESLTQSAIVTYENFVVPDNNSVRFRTSEQEFRYRNGSKMVLGGMDKASKVLSSEYDMIYIMEGTELAEDDYEILTTRCRYGIMPYNQVITDCNPNSPRHWLHMRWREKRLSYIQSVHEDNPVYFDHVANKWTVKGENYISKLRSLTGVRRKRLYEGIWAAAEGMIYQDEWDYTRNVIARREIPLSWRRFWVVDFGFTNPLVWQAWAMDDDGRLYMYAEIYQTRLLVEDLCAMIKSWKRREAEPFPEDIICDWDAEGRATLERHLGIITTPANKNVLEGIENVKSMLAVKEDGSPRMFYMRDSLLELDMDLKESGRPICTIDEYDGYEWDDNKKKEAPRKVDDHGMDGSRYMASHVVDDSMTWVRGRKK